MSKSGPLVGTKILEIAGVGPGPFCAMMLADMGATVLRVEREGAPPAIPPIDPVKNLLHRGRQTISLNLKDPEAVETVLWGANEVHRQTAKLWNSGSAGQHRQTRCA